MKSKPFIDEAGFWGRLCGLLQTDSAPQIARQFSLTKQAVYQWRDGKMPGLEVLAIIAESTGASLDWLVSGRGEPFPSTVPLVEEIEKIARRVARQVFAEENEKDRESGTVLGFEPIPYPTEGMIPVPIVSAEDVWKSMQKKTKT